MSSLSRNPGADVQWLKWAVNPKKGDFTPKMDGENNGKPYEQMDDLGVFPTIFGNTQMYLVPQ